MQEVVCYTCGRIVHISPDAELCSVCGENLRELLHPVYASKYFYDRAASLAAGDQLQPALLEIDRGLRYQPSSELRLLGAILAKRLGDFEQMRYHVAAIPVDDILRPEGEWLLRSHQTRQRELREANKGGPANRASSALTLEPDPPYTIRQVQSTIAVATPPKATRRFGYMTVLAGLFILVVASSAWAARNSAFFTALLGTADETASSATELAAPVHQPAQPEAANPTPVIVATLVLTPTVIRTPDVPDNVVKLVATPTPAGAEVAASTPGVVVGLNATQPFDLQSYLVGLNRSDLAQLGVSAARQGDVLSLQGLVPSFVARQDLLELTQRIPGVTTVRAVDLLLRLPPVYIVQPGDTLWKLAYDFYGNTDKIAVLLDANRDILPSPESLSVGMELKIPEAE